MLSNSSIRIGCSGWQYRHWRGDLYPADLPQSRWFEHYAAIFDTVEVNVYVRFHGVQRYSGSYSDAVLDEWSDWLTMRARAGAPVFAYFNNDTGGHAPRDAVRLRRLIAQTSANL